MSCISCMCSEKLSWTCSDRTPQYNRYEFEYIQIDLSRLDAEDGQRCHGVVMRPYRRRILCRRFMTMLLVERAAKQMAEQVDVMMALQVFNLCAIRNRLRVVCDI